MYKVALNINNDEATGDRSDFTCFLVTFLFNKLYLYTVNALNVPAKHQAYYLCISMLYFASMDRISNISKRNIVLESI